MATIKKPAKKMQMGGKEPKKKTGMDALKAVGKYVSTFGGATERDDPKQKDINIVKKLKETGNKVKNKLGLKKGGTVKKMQGGGVMNTKLKDVPGKVKNTVKRAVDKVKNSTVADAVNVATGGGYSAVKALRNQIGPINDRMPKKKMGGAVKAKNGKSFPDLNKDGKITKADILKGRGVIAKSGAKLKKQAAVAIAMKKAGKAPKKMQYGGAAASMVPPMMKKGGATKKCKYGCK
jgi:hypothetical protein